MEKQKNVIQEQWFKISAPTWNDECDLPGESYSISDIQNYFECILQRYGEKINDNDLSKEYM